ncbi:SirA-like protein [Oxobacter pfennigii]|uniref:SirA-like protein n=1 Tax=Oxobacter pfennigii TaxID=36849 RepID=A0A0P8W2Z0_9CLOT|nr:sulfurtransferase-like selenium metabolism protein YedF [Oxobacter pfennigii]KPU42937.1 SirA-like protein [Oxobacter pfennigii]
MKTIDCRGLACPKPVILTKKELDAEEDTEVTTIVDNDVAVQNLKKFAESIGGKSKMEEKEGFFYVTITKTGDRCIISDDDKNLVIFAGTDKLGSGDDKLGEALMKSYMFALCEADTIPKTIVFVNSGVKLTTEGSAVLESLEKLQSRGVEIMSCGTCLDFYNLKEQLKIGAITNMYTIVEKMNNASNTIKL